MDALFKAGSLLFSYRVAGIVIQDGKILLQKLPHESGFAFPGGHPEVGETSRAALAREFKEEFGLEIGVADLKWVGENFFPWGGRPCHQICLYYLVSLKDHTATGLPEAFLIKEQIEGRVFDLEIHWIPLQDIEQLEIYPADARYLLKNLAAPVQSFVFYEQGYQDLIGVSHK